MPRKRPLWEGDRDRLVSCTAKAWRHLGPRYVRCLVSPDGTVRVWDETGERAGASSYTSCHALSERSQRRIRKLACSEGRPV